jgi:hypothetical protein
LDAVLTSLRERNALGGPRALGRYSEGAFPYQQFSFWHAKGSRLPIDTDMVKVVISIGPRR